MHPRITNPRGYLKFSEKVTPERLEEFAAELAKDPKFLSLYIRKVSSNQHGIGFVYDIDSSTRDASDRFNDYIKDLALRKFGTGLAGWDMASSYILIK